MALEAVTEVVKLAVPETSSLMAAYIARPDGVGCWPSVVVCGEIFGMTRHIRNVADRIAKEGYLAVVPDFYHRTDPETALGYDDAGRERGMSLMKQLRRPEVLTDLRVVIEYLRTRLDTTSRTGIIGFSLGGHIAYLAATQFDLPATALFYGGWITNTDILLSRQWR